MRIAKKINLKIYILTGLSVQVLCFFFSSTITEYLLVVLTSLCSILNQITLKYLTDILISSAIRSPKTHSKDNRLKVVFLVLFKMLVLILPFVAYVQLASNKIILALINYIGHLGALGLGMLFQKKK